MAKLCSPSVCISLLPCGQTAPIHTPKTRRSTPIPGILLESIADPFAMCFFYLIDGLPWPLLLQHLSSNKHHNSFPRSSVIRGALTYFEMALWMQVLRTVRRASRCGFRVHFGVMLSD